MGHGTSLAGRYRLEERVRAGTDGALWRAVDEILDRQVSVQVFRSGHEHTADVVDAARRAALVEDARLIRVLDVGESSGSAFIVTERIVGRTLAELLVEGPIPAETARRLTGEAAEALERASARGLHHLRLTPESIVVAPNGGVKVLGTAVEAALAGLEQDGDAVSADRADAVGLVQVLYAGLTGRWPGDPEGALGPAPKVTGQAVPPADLVAGVPNDLDTLCAVTLGPHDDGPRSAGELARQLAPWASTEPLTDPKGLAVSGPGRPAPDSVEALVAHAAAGRRVDHPPVVDPDAEEPVAVGAGRSSTAASPRDDASDASGSEWSRLSKPVPTAPPTPTAPAPTRPGAAAPSRPGAAARLAGKNPSGPDSEPIGPFIPPAPLSRPPQDQTRFVLAVVGGLVVAGLILAVFSLRGLLGGSDPLVQPAPLIPTPAPASTSAAAAPPPSAPVGSPQASSTGSPAASPSVSSSATPVEISGIQAIDPQGDGDENGSTADRAIDGDSSTIWKSARYQSASFGGLKQGLGLYLQVTGGPVTSVTVDMPGRGGTVELRTAAGPGLDATTVVATATAADGRAVITPAKPLPGGPLLLWFTGLPQQDGGDYRLVVSEITIA